MPCYHPITAWYSKEVNSSGKRSLVFNPSQALQPDDPQEISCGQCVGCRLERSRQWATRCLHEASLYEDNCFITLTFSPEVLQTRDNPWSLDVRDFQLFMKRLRKRFGSRIRFYHCGEYGENNGRPHYHACLFNFDFPDKKLWKKVGEHNLYVSKELETIWGQGFCSIGDVTFESAAYVARYIMKKINGDRAEEHYQWVDDETGEIRPLKPEYTTMSRNPGIGKEWFDKFSYDVYKDDFVVINGKKCRPPKFYDTQLEKLDPAMYDELKDARLNNIDRMHKDLTPERLEARERCQKLRMKRLPRNHDL